LKVEIATERTACGGGARIVFEEEFSRGKNGGEGKEKQRC
jgi:hypothetical protein